MNLQDCIKFANEHPMCSIATTEGDQPRVRIFAMWYADDNGFYFHSGYPKAICQQLKKNPKTEICFYAPAPPPDPGAMLRVAGEVEFLDDMAIKEKLLQERPFLKDIGVSGPDDPMLAVFRIPHGEAYFWTMAVNMREQESERVKF